MADNGTVIEFPFSPNYSFILPFERNFDKEYRRQWMIENWNLCIYLSVVYVSLAFIGQRWMKSRSSFNIRSILIVWNIVLSIFSAFGAYRTLPELFYVLNNYGAHFSVCDRSYVEFNKITGFWAWTFTLSKLVELTDTLFIVLRKQKLLFIHWTHHISALCTSWYIYSDHPAMGRWMMTANYSVHAIMYAYYALRAGKVKVPRPIAMTITTMQIVQMIICFAASFYTFIAKINGWECGISWHAAITVLMVYGTFFSLFLHLFLQNYTGIFKRFAKDRSSDMPTKKID